MLYDLHIKRNLVSIGQKIIQETIGNDENIEGINLIENAENDLYLLSKTGESERKYSLLIIFTDFIKCFYIFFFRTEIIFKTF